MPDRLTGLGVVPGVAVGLAHRWSRTGPPATGAVAATKEAELSLLEDGLRQTRHQLLKIIDRVSPRIGEAEVKIFRSHLALLTDPLLLDRINEQIGQGMSAAGAVRQAVSLLSGKLDALSTQRMRERAEDLRDIGRRLVVNLLNVASSNSLEEAEGILCAQDLAPSEISCLDVERVRGIVLEQGTATSHTVILARAFGIPTVVSVKGLLAGLNHGDLLILDGRTGEVIIRPDNETAELYRQRSLTGDQPDSRPHRTPVLPAVTLDGCRITLGANIGSPREIHAAIASGAEEVGLFRTEFLFLNRDAEPEEEEQFIAYREVLAAMAPRRVVTRTADMGGDKQAAFLGLRPEPNPALGLRGIRLSLERDQFFRSQIRAMLRASGFGNLAILLPMITDTSELRHARTIISGIAQELREQGERIGESIPVGVMVETPAAALMAEALVQEADFLSIGTNDLTQYVLAADRLNEQVSHLYQPLHPAVIRLMNEVSQAAGRKGKALSICGELAGDPTAAALFVALGVTGLSMSPNRIAPVAEAIARLRKSDAAVTLQEALASKDSGKSAALIRRTTDQGSCSR